MHFRTVVAPRVRRRRAWGSFFAPERTQLVVPTKWRTSHQWRAAERKMKRPHLRVPWTKTFRGVVRFAGRKRSLCRTAQFQRTCNASLIYTACIANEIDDRTNCLPRAPASWCIDPHRANERPTVSCWLLSAIQQVFKSYQIIFQNTLACSSILGQCWRSGRENNVKNLSSQFMHCVFMSNNRLLTQTWRSSRSLSAQRAH